MRRPRRQPPPEGETLDGLLGDAAGALRERGRGEDTARALERVRDTKKKGME